MSKITRNENGQYVWEYELDMYRNRNIFDLVMKILTVIFVFIIFAVTSMAVFNRTFDLDSLWFFLKIAIPIFLFVYLIAYLAYRFYALSLGGVYHVRFEMDEEGVNHIPMKKEQEYNKKMGLASMVAGMVTKNYGQVGTGMYLASLENIYSQFDKVTSVKADRAHDLINVNYMTQNNQVYADKEDYDFVFDYIASHCPNAKIKDM